MAIAVWPASLPNKFIVEKFQENFPNNIYRYTPDAGMGKVRRKGAAPPATISVSFVLTADQRDTLKNFVKFSLKDGTLRFEFVHPIDLYTFEARILSSDKDLYVIDPYKNDFMVTLNLEILP